MSRWYKGFWCGFEVSPIGQPFTLKENKPVDNGWKVIIEYSTNPEGIFTVYAQCEKLVPNN